jgi:hypothetical protein
MTLYWKEEHRIEIDDQVLICCDSVYYGRIGKVIKIDLWSPDERMLTVDFDGGVPQRFLESQVEFV